MPTSLEHIPNTAMDLKLLEATRQVATVQMERHLDRRENWLADEVFSPDLMAELLPHHNKVELPPGLGEAVDVFIFTEDAIVWYGRDFSKIFNPTGKRPDNNDPHETFSRHWTSEEYQHGIAQRDTARVLGRDMPQIELDRQAVIIAAEVPEGNTAQGIAFTGTQEALTAAPYQVLVEKFRELEKTALLEGRTEVAKICQVAAEMYRHIAQDERLHKSFITSIGQAALWSGDPALQEYMLSALLDESRNFGMPIQRTIPRVRRFVSIKKAGIYTSDMVKDAQHRLLKHTYKVDQIPNLRGKAAELQQKLGDFILGLKPVNEVLS